MKAAVVALAWGLLGCTYLRSGQGQLEHHTLVATGSDCVIVLLPGLGDPPGSFSKHAFEAALDQSGARCDLEVVDTHFGYYRDAVIADRLAGRLEQLRSTYDRIWLAGVSLGGYGAALTAKARPDLVDGVVLISPFLGVPNAVRPLVTRIQNEGGLEALERVAPPVHPPRKHFLLAEPLWQWLAQRARNEGEGPRLVLAYGARDGFAWKHRVVAAALAPGDVLEHPEGGHEWATFRALWQGVAADAPWNDGASRSD